MNFKKCSCRHCRSGLHRPKGYGKMIAKVTRRKARRIERDMIKKGDYNNIPEKISLPYTD